MVIVVMGAAGAGKSTVGRALAENLGWLFVDADDDRVSTTRTRAGDGTSDAEPVTWLRDLHALVARTLDRREHLVLACSALRASHREALRGGLRPVRFAYLKGARPMLEARLEQRRGRATGVAQLHSQLVEIEDPGETALTLDASQPVEILVPTIRRELGL
ncbi:MAG: gluconokinase [Vicinamibacterales bacterium]